MDAETTTRNINTDNTINNITDINTTNNIHINKYNK